MTVEVERTMDVNIDIEEVWDLLADPENRADAISVVDHHEVEQQDREEGDVVIWHIGIPIPLIEETIPIRTWETERDPPTYVHYVGESSMMDMTGEHELERLEDGKSRVTSRFTVDGNLPGIESYFESQIDGEIDNLVKWVERRHGQV